MLNSFVDQVRNFAIHPETGWISARVTFDREQKQMYRVTVSATDHGANPKSTNAVVMVEVLDKNEPPRFPASYRVFVTDENIPLGTVVGRVLALDGDQGKLFLTMYFL